MNRRSWSTGLIGAGLVLTLLSALANPLGIGVEGFGWKQVVGVVVGVAAVLAGAGLAALSSRAS